ncbi:MAG: prephenate dehydrogenase [Marinifilaceae bacterium]
MKRDRKIGVIGLGLIGGSMAIDLKQRGFCSEVLGVESNPLHAATAEHMELVDRIVTVDECMDECELIIIATPVDVANGLLKTLLDKSSNQIITDVCSTKGLITSSVANHPQRGRYVSGHPMAGTEYSGPWAAMSGLFDGRAGILCNTEESDNDAVETVASMYDCLNMRTLTMSATDHDVHAAYVSHISHITSFALALTVLEKEQNEKHIFDLASGGFSSTVRLAKSSSAMWTPILTRNKHNVLEVLDTYMEKLSKFREAIANENREDIGSLIQEANRIRRIIR